MVNFNKIQKRINDPETIDYNLIDSELKQGKHVIVQFSGKSYKDKTLKELDDLCLRYDENFGVRFYGHYSTSFDCKTLEKIPKVKSLYIDCLMNADNIYSLKELNHLEMLSIGVFELKDTEILAADNFKKLKTLIVTDTRTKAINLEYLREYKDLSSLIVCGHTKRIESIGELSNLDCLYLNSICKVPIGFINRLKKLKTLKLILGGRENIGEIEENEIETLEIIRVRGFNNFCNVTNFRKLRNLLIEDQIRLSELNFDKPFKDLQDLKILNCKTFTLLKGLENLGSLRQLRIYQTNIDFDTLIKQKRPESLKIFAFYTAKTKVDKEISDILKNMGYSDGLENHNKSV